MEALELKNVEEQLYQQRKMLLQRIQREEKKITSTEVLNPDRSDLASSYDQQQRRTAILERAKSQLAEVEDALQRLSQNRFGECTNCGEQINPERLAAIPSAPLCLACQQKQEKR